MSFKEVEGVPLLVSERVMAQKGLALSSLLRAVSASESVPVALQEMVEIIRKSVGAVSITIGLEHDGKQHSVESLPVHDEKVRPDALSKTPVKGFLMASGGIGSTPIEGYPVADFSPPHDGFDLSPSPSVRGRMDIPLSDPVRGFIAWLLDEHAPASLVQAFMTMMVEDLAVILADVLRRQEQRDEVERLQHIRKVAQHFAHDVRSPITALKMSSETPPDPEIVGLALENVYQTAKVYGDLLLSRGPAFSRQDLSRVVQDTLKEVQSFPEIREKGFVWKVTVEAGDLSVLVSEALLKNAVQNLLQNSAHFAPKGGVISVAVRRGLFPRVDPDSEPARPAILITVEDDGPGISAEQRTKLFHTPVPVSTRPGGSGVGLGSVYQTVHHFHQGEVHVESVTGEGSFTRFTIALPVSVASSLVASPLPVEKRESLEVLRGVTILMNEDDVNLNRLMRSIFSHAGLLPRSVGNLEEFLRCLPDLSDGAIAILDQQTSMPIDAVSLAAIIKRRRPDMIVVFCSGFYSGCEKPPHPFDGAVAKPFHQDALLQLLADLAREKKRS